jgi:hypothetical protein
MEGRFKVNQHGIAIHVEMNWVELNAFIKALVVTITTLVALGHHPVIQQLIAQVGLR